MPDSEVKHIKPIELLNTVSEYKSQGCRLVQICGSKSGEGYELDYSFDHDYKFIDLKVAVNPGDEIPSISAIFAPAFLYENEIEALFGIKVLHMSVDFEGKLYVTAKKTPFAVEKKEEQ